MQNQPLTGITIAVSRPVDQAQALCEAIIHLGGRAVLFPLLAIAPLPDYHVFEQQLAELETTDWAIFISSNAVNNAMPRVLKHYGNIPDNLKFAAIGHQTAKELAHYGVRNVLTPHTRFDSETLLALPEMHDVANMKIAIFRGVGGRELMAETLTARGANVYFAESYQRINPQTDANLLAELWKKGELQAIIVTSSEAMRYLLDLAGTSEWLHHVVICVNHARIAELPLQLGLKVLVADAPSDEAMLKTISNSYLDDSFSQKAICTQYGSEFKLPNQFEKVGIALNTLGQLPINALRHPAENDNCGWYIWGGEIFSQDPDFFQPLHVKHLSVHCPEIIPFLALAPGWRVLLAPNQIDVWYEKTLLDLYK